MAAVESRKRRVARYWPGKVPDYARQQIENELAEKQRKAEILLRKRLEEDQLREQERGRVAEIVDDDDHISTRAEAAVVIKDEAGIDEAVPDDGDDGDEIVEDERLDEERRARLRARALALEDQEEDEMDEDDEIELGDGAVIEEEEHVGVIGRRREQMREGEVLAGEDAEEMEESEDEESSGWETESDFEEDGAGDSHRMFKPTFVEKDERATVAERDAREAAEEAARESSEAAARQRKIHTSELIEAAVKEELSKDTLKKGPKDAELEVVPDDSDDVDEQLEYDLWKQREVARIRRSRDTASATDDAEKDKARRARMTDMEVMNENRQLRPDKEKTKMSFLQRYYHKGVFFMGDDKASSEVVDRDYTAPTGEDKIDKSILPKIMQVKRFGRRSNTKYTNLMEEDTSQGQLAEGSVYADSLSATQMAPRRRQTVPGEFARPAKRAKKR